METTQNEPRDPNPTVNQLLIQSQRDLTDVLATRFNGLTYPRLTWGSLSNLSPEQATLLSAALLATVAHSQLLSLVATSELGIGRQTLTNLADWQSGYEKALHLIDCMCLVAATDVALDESV